ncbi:hypothetical protein BDAG_00542 [Burkholderia dolosa AU0158]|nr:hypothetical protein BDAG_00542 [Burkholderia dolosa AU0158]
MRCAQSRSRCCASRRALRSTTKRRSSSTFGPSLRLVRRLAVAVPPGCARTLAALGYAARVSAAPTAGGAWLLARVSARARVRRRVIGHASFVRALDGLPCGLLRDARAHAGWFDGLGCRTLADLRRLPRAGLQRRCGPALLAALDRAYGDAVEPIAWMPVPPVFDVRLELPERVEYAEAVLFAARRLVVQLCGWLAARQLSLAAMTFGLEHERGRQGRAADAARTRVRDARARRSAFHAAARRTACARGVAGRGDRGDAEGHARRIGRAAARRSFPRAGRHERDACAAVRTADRAARRGERAARGAGSRSSARGGRTAGLPARCPGRQAARACPPAVSPRPRVAAGGAVAAAGAREPAGVPYAAAG